MMATTDEHRERLNTEKHAIDEQMQAALNALAAVVTRARQHNEDVRSWQRVEAQRQHPGFEGFFPGQARDLYCLWRELVHDPAPVATWRGWRVALADDLCYLGGPPYPDRTPTKNHITIETGEHAA